MATSPGRRKLGWTLTAIGILMIVGGVFYVLETVGYAEDQRFENRRSYNQVKVAVHESFPLAFGIGIAGLGIAMLGARLRAGSEAEPDEDDVG